MKSIEGQTVTSMKTICINLVSGLEEGGSLWEHITNTITSISDIDSQESVFTTLEAEFSRMILSKNRHVGIYQKQYYDFVLMTQKFFAEIVKIDLIVDFSSLQLSEAEKIEIYSKSRSGIPLLADEYEKLLPIIVTS